MFEILIQTVNWLISLLKYKGEIDRAFFDELITPCFTELKLIHKNYLEYFTHLSSICPEFDDPQYKEKMIVLEATARKMRTECETARTKVTEYSALICKLKSDRSRKIFEQYKKTRVKGKETDNVFLFHEAVYEYFTETVRDEFGVEAFLSHDTSSKADEQLLDSISLWDTTYAKNESPGGRMVSLLEKINYLASSDELATLLLEESNDIDVKRLLQLYLVFLRKKWKKICRCYNKLEVETKISL